MQHQCQMAFADTSFNSFQTVLLNVYQNFVFCAMKFHVYTQELIQDPVTAHHIQKECLAGKEALLAQKERCYSRFICCIF